MKYSAELHTFLLGDTDVIPMLASLPVQLEGLAWRKCHPTLLQSLGLKTNKDLTLPLLRSTGILPLASKQEG